jgi:simple sugar transport system ATP-binding protein
VHRELLALQAKGAGILLISTELDEILKLSNRIVVLYEGEIMGVLPSQQADRQQLGLLMAGMHLGDGAEPGKTLTKPSVGPTPAGQ